MRTARIPATATTTRTIDLDGLTIPAGSRLFGEVRGDGYFYFVRQEFAGDGIQVGEQEHQISCECKSLSIEYGHDPKAERMEKPVHLALFFLFVALLASCTKAPADVEPSGVWRSTAPPYWTIYVSDGYYRQSIVSEAYTLEYAYRTDGDTLTLTPFQGNPVRRQVWRIAGQTATVEEIGQEVPVMELNKLSE